VYSIIRLQWFCWVYKSMCIWQRKTLLVSTNQDSEFCCCRPTQMLINWLLGRHSLDGQHTYIHAQWHWSQFCWRLLRNKSVTCRRGQKSILSVVSCWFPNSITTLPHLWGSNLGKRVMDFRHNCLTAVAAAAADDDVMMMMQVSIHWGSHTTRWCSSLLYQQVSTGCTFCI